MTKFIGITNPDCQHHWKVYMTRHGKAPGVVKVRYYRCLKCGSTKKTVETETDFIYQR